jgi:hypothetical protein
VKRELDIIKNVITDKNYRFLYLESKGFYKYMDDEELIRKIYRIRMGKELDLENPTTLCEKLQWLKLHDQNELYHKLVDKYEVKKWVSNKIGAEHVIPCYGVWDSVDNIEYFKMPQKFVLKCTHDSGGIFYCDKYETDFKQLKKKIRKHQANSVYWNGGGREWAYKDVMPRILGEEYIPELGNKDSIEYKVTCFNGRAEFVTICKGVAHGDFSERFNDHYDRNWNKLPFFVNYKSSGETISKPSFMDEIIEYAEILAKDIPQVRVDGYYINGRYLFGEMTFYTWNGFMKFEPEEWDTILGERLDLSEIAQNKIINFVPREKKEDLN